MATGVLVVGAGPVGLTAALELVRYGVPVRIIDKLPQRSDKSKALAVWPRTLELMERGGVSADLIAAGLQASGARLMAGPEELGHISIEHVDSAYRFLLLITQDETERVLEEHLNTLGVRVERGVELTAFSQSPESVTATLSRPNAGPETLETGWLLGCDGAHSFVRHTLGKQFEGSTIPTDFVLADVHIRGENISSSEMNMFAHRDGILMFFPIHAGRFRVIADVGPAVGPHPIDASLADVQAIIDQRGPGNVTAFDSIWLSGFRVNERKVEDYRGGRAFLAGDAAHVHSPAGGQGMNTGMQDAVNLSWKLALVASGTCREEPLLESYDAERSPVARTVLDESGRLASLMTVQNAMLQTLRNHAIHLFFGFAPVREKMAETLSELSIGYPKSPLTHPGEPFAEGPTAGSRAPLPTGEAPVGGGTKPRFALFAESGAGNEELAAEFPDLLEPALRPPFHAGGTWLVRPDGYIAIARGNARDVGSYLKALTSSEKS